MKKLSLILVLALVMVGAFSAVALADISHPNNAGISADGTYSMGATGQIYLPPGSGGAPGYAAIHSNYTANTDACAACHAPHTANGDSLTQWDTFSNSAGLTNVCLACHDGTVTATYNVVNGTVGNTSTPSNGGLFAIYKDGAQATADSASQHNVFSGLTIGGAAFGGATTATADSNGSWDGTFDCTSCHSPHGQGGNSRILTPDPNDVNSTTTITLTWSTTIDGTNSGWVFPASERPILGYPYGVTFKDGGTTNSTIKLRFSTDTTVPVVWGIQGSSSPTDTVTAIFTPVLQVNFTIANKLTSAETVSYNYGINTFCGACHTDYDTEAIYLATTNLPGGNTSVSNLNGTYSQHTRHAVGYQFFGAIPAGTLKFQSYTDHGQTAQANTVTCLTCHFAHGVDQSRWAISATTSGIAAYNSAETAGSSRLKRLPNMGVCEACHDKEDGAYSVNAVTQLMK